MVWQVRPQVDGPYSPYRKSFSRPQNEEFAHRPFFRYNVSVMAPVFPGDPLL